MKTINWKGNAIAVGCIGAVAATYLYFNPIQFNQVDPATKAIHERTEQDLKNITASQTDNSPDIVTEDVNGKIHQVDSTSTDDSTSTETTKPEPKVGMYSQDIKNTFWGEPEDKTVTKDKYGSRELWIYSGGRSLFFEDGVLESITEK